ARSGIGERRGEPSGAPAHEIGRPSAPIGASSPADAGSWRRGMIVTRTAGDGGEMQHSSASKSFMRSPVRARGLSRRDVQQQHKTADDDRNWRKK
uniref:Uncharacterized protein n=1 Tax=Parascaris equorum TaxID=6256 RepID=A0A914RZQ2_PAREQ